MNVLLLILSFILFSCDVDNCTLCSNENADGNYIEIDATDNNSWVYYRFEDDGTMEKFEIPPPILKIMFFGILHFRDII